MTPLIEPVDEAIRLEDIRLEANEKLSNLDILKSDISLMFKFAVNTEKELPANLNLSEKDNYPTLIADHNSLIKVIKPVSPRKKKSPIIIKTNGLSISFTYFFI